MTIAAIVQIITDLVLDLIKKWKLKGLEKEAQEAKEKANEILAKERDDYEQFMHDAADYWESTSGPQNSSPDVQQPAGTLPTNSSGAAKDNRSSGKPKRKAGSRNRRTKFPVKRGKGKSLPRK